MVCLIMAVSYCTVYVNPHFSMNSLIVVTFTFMDTVSILILLNSSRVMGEEHEWQNAVFVTFRRAERKAV